ncbi:hypothetical protein [Roseovarius pelagicus]|uniref:Leucyl aminopeptidase (Aminopeptidase T) n=1 Tax=Roseovarius pelagicus TaxID=2980108 RepID=A0ABY6DEZ6_9RHOB|nr:hypothetical protein [Roseovarius pelagicus]UXX83808.1 hypothetical protein N7U68_03880 [Roseovarius pelagicus]
MTQAAINPGALNLVANCARVTPDEHVLVAIESPDLGYYGADLAPSIIDALTRLGARVECMNVAFDPEAREVPSALMERMLEADVLISLARIGDQLRFDNAPGRARMVQCYALNAAMLRSSFGVAPYGAFTALKTAVDTALFNAGQIVISCADGTHLTGHAPAMAIPSDTTCARFPLSVFSPVPARHFTGRLALPEFLIGTGSRYYESFYEPLNAGTFAEMQDGRLAGFSGDAGGIQQANAHYDHVSARYGLDRYAVHSWHAGIHPGCAYDDSVENTPERWSGSAFGNPRILHFHTCGTQPPGEICWNVIDPTIELDGVRLWDNGVFYPDRLPQAARVLADFPELPPLFAAPERQIGV